VPFRNGVALVGEAGSETVSNSALRRFRNAASETTIKDRETVLKTARQALREEFEELKTANGATDDDAVRRMILDVGYCDWLLCAPFERGNTIELHHLRSDRLTAMPVTNGRIAVGIGSDLANYLLGRMIRPEFTVLDAAALASYIIHEVKENVSGCSGFTQVSIAAPWGVHEYPLAEIMEAERELKSADGFLKVIWDNYVESILDAKLSGFQKALNQMKRHVKNNPQDASLTVEEVCARIDKARKKTREISAARASLKEERVKRPLP
jgi:hypothetical protein